MYVVTTLRISYEKMGRYDILIYIFHEIDKIDQIKWLPLITFLFWRDFIIKIAVI